MKWALARSKARRAILFQPSPVQARKPVCECQPPTFGADHAFVAFNLLSDRRFQLVIQLLGTVDLIDDHRGREETKNLFVAGHLPSLQCRDARKRPAFHPFQKCPARRRHESEILRDAGMIERGDRVTTPGH